MARLADLSRVNFFCPTPVANITETSAVISQSDCVIRQTVQSSSTANNLTQEIYLAVVHIYVKIIIFVSENGRSDAWTATVIT